MKLKKLTKAELIHLLEDVVGENAVERAWKSTREYQKANGVRCWDCESIEKKIGWSPWYVMKEEKK